MKNKHVELLSATMAGSKSLLDWVGIFEQHLMTKNEKFDPGHRIEHVQRVADTAIQLALEENADLEVIVPAIWLHDSVPISKFSDDRARSSIISADFVAGFLLEVGYPQNKMPQIRHAIEAHSFSGGIQPKSLEAEIVQDADRLDALGAIGIARTFMVGGEFKNALYNPDEPFPSVRTANDKKFIIDHFFIKLLKLKDTLRTKSARIEGNQRTKFMCDFLQQLAKEIGVELNLSFDNTLPLNKAETPLPTLIDHSFICKESKTTAPDSPAFNIPNYLEESASKPKL